MSTVPKGTLQKISWYEEHAALWVANQAPLNLTSAQTTLLTTTLAGAKDALAEQQAARTLMKGKTMALREALNALSDVGGDLLKDIRATAAAAPAGGTEIYQLAGIPAPATPSPVPPPGTPFEFKVQLMPADGSLHLVWKCNNPANANGVWYEVERRIGPAVGSAGGFVLLGNAGKRMFIDPTVPAGSAEVLYRITAARTTGKGQAATFLVQFGTGGSGEMTATVVSPRIAA